MQGSIVYHAIRFAPERQKSQPTINQFVCARTRKRRISGHAHSTERIVRPQLLPAKDLPGQSKNIPRSSS